MPFIFQRSEIPDVVVITPEVFKDERGFFMEVYKENDFSDFGIKEKFIQENYSFSPKGVLRGLHFQIPPFEQRKIVRAIRGEIFDVAVDIRKDSPTYKQWVGFVLSEENKKMLYIPNGFAHGFCVLSDAAGVAYQCANFYSPEHEKGIIWNDTELAIKWPIDGPILSLKDSRLPRLKELVAPSLF